MRVISERQYLRFPCSDCLKLDEALVESLKHWRSLVANGPPRPIDLQVRKSDDVITDGFAQDPREQDTRPDRIGAVMVDRRLTSPVQFTGVVPKTMKWLDRKTQIVPDSPG